MRRAGQARPGEALLWLMPADIGYILAGDDYHFCSREDQISNCWVGKDVCMYVCPHGADADTYSQAERGSGLHTGYGCTGPWRGVVVM